MANSTARGQSEVELFAIEAIRCASKKSLSYQMAGLGSDECHWRDSSWWLASLVDRAVLHPMTDSNNHTTAEIPQNFIDGLLVLAGIALQDDEGNLNAFPC